MKKMSLLLLVSFGFYNLKADHTAIQYGKIAGTVDYHGKLMEMDSKSRLVHAYKDQKYLNDEITKLLKASEQENVSLTPEVKKFAAEALNHSKEMIKNREQQVKRSIEAYKKFQKLRQQASLSLEKKYHSKKDAYTATKTIE